MTETTQNIIKNKYSELIHLISQISDDVRIEDKHSKLSLFIDVYVNKGKLISFKLYKATESIDFLDIDWGVLGSTIGHWCFPDYFNQSYMFNTLTSKITEWYNKIINSNIDNILKQTQNKIIKEKSTSIENDKDNPADLSFTAGHFGVDYLSLDQKYALLGEITYFSSLLSVFQNKKNEIAEILDKYKDTLRINFVHRDSSYFNQYIGYKSLCEETIKTIDLDGPFIPFITYCMQLIELDINNESIFNRFHTLLLDIGYTDEEADIICNCDFVFRFK